MSRIPPGLLYLTIFNPALHFSGPSTPDDDDAEEQAHVLFYTARERAVSRDRILRQVGLAKALINFSNMFTSAACENIHSQSRRMVLVSPEDNYWIHACVEVAKTPRPVVVKGKGKGKGKEPAAPTEPVYDYHDGSVHDVALRAHLLRGYEEFKLRHGSFSSIMSSLGQEALELQLERFWTVWAWKWDLEEDIEFGTQLGVPLHPLYRSLSPLLDNDALALPQDTTTFVLCPPYVIPSDRLLSSKHSAPLLRYILSQIPPTPPPIIATPPLAQAPPETPKEPLPNKPNGSIPLISAPADGKPVDSKPLIDMRGLKWNWPGYLTFGKNTSAKSSVPPTPSITSPTTAIPVPHEEKPPGSKPSVQEPGREPVDVEVDTESLLDAMSTSSIHAPSTNVTPPGTPLSTPLPLPTQDELQESASIDTESTTSGISVDDQAGDEGASPAASIADQIEVSAAAVDGGLRTEPDTHLPMSSDAFPSFVPTTVHLTQGDDAHGSERKRVLHATRGQLTFALLVDYDQEVDTKTLAERTLKLFQDLKSAIDDERAKAAAETPIPSVTKILEPQSRHVISTGGCTTSSQPGLSSNSEHLFNGQQLLDSDLDIREVFSRGQNPQHWHVSRRGLGTDQYGNTIDGEVYMEVARKESTLTDVDNELAGVVRRFME